MTDATPRTVAPDEPRTALVTGATGYVGQNLVPRLLEEGWRVLTRRRSSIDDRNDDAVRRTMADAVPDHGLRNLVIAAAATTGCAVTGALATDPESRWYRSLDLPPWQPPTLAFPTVWTALYADIALTSAASVTAMERERGPELEQSDRHGDGHSDRRGEIAAYWRALALNLALNATWSATFWRSRRPALAAVHAAALTLSSADLARRSGDSGSTRRRALLPYAAWCGFATALSAEIARRNRGRS